MRRRDGDGGDSRGAANGDVGPQMLIRDCTTRDWTRVAREEGTADGSLFFFLPDLSLFSFFSTFFFPFFRFLIRVNFVYIQIQSLYMRIQSLYIIDIFFGFIPILCIHIYCFIPTLYTHI